MAVVRLSPRRSVLPPPTRWLSTVAPSPTSADTDSKAPPKWGKTRPAEKTDAHVYAHTVRLPSTSLPIIELATAREARVQSLWKGLGNGAGLYEWQRSVRPGAADRPAFVLHDGPPYANGRLHIGHVLNKALKDIVNRYRLLRGHRIDFIPGWDCHGLPIEQKALAAIGANSTAQRSALSPMDIRRTARQFALSAIEQQRADFQSWGVMADWPKPYLTLDPLYEARQIRAFGRLFANGQIIRKRKPVNWSPSSGSALAVRPVDRARAPPPGAWLPAP
jgi:isoleucyl-tRNA synthetase